MTAELSAVLLAGMALLGSAPQLGEPLERWKLPGELREISGLATTADGRVLAHDDERATVYELDVAAESVVRRWKLRAGGKTLRGDFEGIAVRGNELWLMTSSGGLVRTQPDVAGATPNVIDTGLARECEFEGLAVRDGVLVLACKTLLDGGRGSRLVLWDPASAAVTGRITLTPPALHVSALEWCPRQERFVGLAAREHQLFTAAADGQVEMRFNLDTDRHPQPEGITFAGGELLIADEGRNRGRLTRYAWPPCR